MLTTLLLLPAAVLLTVIASRASNGGSGVAEALSLLSTQADRINRIDNIDGENNGDVANDNVDNIDDNYWPSWRITEQRQRRRPSGQDSPLDAVSWLNLRRFVCGSEANVRCLADERFYQLQPEFLRQISARINELTAAAHGKPTGAFLSAGDGDSVASAEELLPAALDEYADDVNIWNSLNLSGRREGPFYVDEPDYVLTQEMDTHRRPHAATAQLFDYINDPFIPQRGRRSVIVAAPRSVATIDRQLLTTHQHRQHNHHHHHHFQQPQRPQTGAFYRRLLPAEAAAAVSLPPLLANNRRYGDADRVDDSGSGRQQTTANMLQPPPRLLQSQLVPRNLSPATGPTTTTAAAAETTATNRDTFYLARGSLSHQQQKQQQQQRQMLPPHADSQQ